MLPSVAIALPHQEKAVIWAFMEEHSKQNEKDAKAAKKGRKGR